MMNLTKVFERAREQSIKFGKYKIQFKVSEVKYLHHIIDKTGAQILIKLKLFKKWIIQKTNKNFNIF